MTRTIYAADLFCGAGGTSSGLMQTCERLGLQVELLAINHWDRAVETHAANHPGAKHLCATLDQVDPSKEVPRRKLDLLVAAPECTHFSVARGGRPMSDQSRASAWHVLHWAERLRVENILIENVREFQSWGPLGANGRPLKSRRGETFQAFIRALESLGYAVEWRVLNCADYGDPTTRQRLFITAVRGHRNRRPNWPSHTHTKMAEPELFNQNLEPWRAAREIIDWSIPGKSIFGRKRPLAPTTLARIAEGLRRFGGKAAEPFLVMLYGTGTARSIDLPAPTVTARGGHIGLAQPFILGHRQFKESCVDSIDRPLRTLTASNGGDTALVEPFILPPLGIGRGNAPRSPDAPLQTVLASRGGGHLIEPFLVTYYGKGGPQHLDSPAPTLTTKDRLGLVQPAHLDIRFRMLQPHELAAAMSFPEGYQFIGNKAEVVRQIGNAVPVRTAAALCEAALRRKIA